MPWQQAILWHIEALPPPPPLRACVLGSGSAGNAVIVESGGRRILIDAGFSCRELEKRMRSVGVEPSSIQALLITHEHVDHNRGAARLAKRHKIPVFATAGTFTGTELGPEQARTSTVIRSGEVREVAGFSVEPFAIPHDAREPIGLVIEDGAGRRLGLCGDIGNRSRLAWGRLADLDLLILETNHDLDMLRNGPYPWSLKQRVAGRHGHLSNREAADGIPELLSHRLRWVVLYHLSRTNNLPALAAAEIGAVLEREGAHAELAVSDQDRPTPWLEIGAAAADSPGAMAALSEAG
ncbi:MAG TPA: MBL fold metallo-hydrolase [Thermoanaerobaculia bacterium]|jgi:phosphoribosyl 1,2-cyclic phosphodiesterase|nr:MBL fold metallo-hydrolase [Thermoanaerobaculia bacterium]